MKYDVVNKATPESTHKQNDYSYIDVATTPEMDLSNEGTSESTHKEKDYSYLDVATTLEHDFIKEATPECTNKEIELQKVKEELEVLKVANVELQSKLNKMNACIKRYYQTSWQKQKDDRNYKELPIEKEISNAIQNLVGITQPSFHLVGVKWQKLARKLCDSILSCRFMGGLVEQEAMRRCQQYYRKEVFPPWKVLRSMDLAGGGCVMKE